MARNDKLGKILLGSALAGAAAGALTYFLKKKGENSSWDDEDLEDFDDNLTDHKAEDEEDDDTPISREYVTIHTDHSHAAEAGEGSESFENEKENDIPEEDTPAKEPEEAEETEAPEETAPAEEAEENAPAEEEAPEEDSPAEEADETSSEEEA